MALFIHVRRQDNGESVVTRIRRQLMQQKVAFFGNIAELTTCLRTALQSDDIVIVQADRAALAALLPCREVLEMGRLVLILAEIDAESIAMAHQLRPRFLAGPDDDYDKVGDVVAKMLTAASGGGAPCPVYLTGGPRDRRWASGGLDFIKNSKGERHGGTGTKTR
jgi:hypothetical protein